MSKATLEEINKTLENAKNKIVLGAKYVHYKNPKDTYTIVDLVIIETTEEVGVVYEANYEKMKGVKFMRPLEEFLGEVEINNTKVPRFKYLKENNS